MSRGAGYARNGVHTRYEHSGNEHCVRFFLVTNELRVQLYGFTDILKDVEIFLFFKKIPKNKAPYSEAYVWKALRYQGRSFCAPDFRSKVVNDLNIFFLFLEFRMANVIGLVRRNFRENRPFFCAVHTKRRSTDGQHSYS